MSARKQGGIYIRQKSVADGKYALINSSNWITATNLTIDTAIQGVVYPMWIKIESASEPTLAEMVEGEQSGGGAGTESTMEYLDITSVTDGKGRIILYSTLAKTPIGIIPSAGLIELVLNMGFESIVNALNYVAMSPTLEVTLNGQPQTISSCIEGYDSIPRITKEQFYNLEA